MRVQTCEGVQMRAFLTVVFILLGAVAQAQEDNAWSFIGNDVYGAGYTLRHDVAPADDIFLAGNTLTVSSDARGDVALAGQMISVSGDVGQDVYAAGQAINIAGKVAGDVTAFGQDIRIGEVGGDLRAAGASVRLDGPVGGYAILGGASVEIAGAIAGDLHLGAESVTFADDVDIGGTLHVYDEPDGETELPAFITDSVTVERHLMEDFPQESPKSFLFKSFLKGVLTVAVLAALIAAVAPARLADMRRALLERPFRGLWMGFLGMSVLIGAGVISALTLVGIILTPAFWLVAGLAGFIGYVIGAYTLGVGLMLAIGMEEPDSLIIRAGAALLGALSAAVIALAPFIGWLFVVVLTLAGTGALVSQVLRPRFFANHI